MNNMTLPKVFGITAISFACLLGACSSNPYPELKNAHVGSDEQSEQTILSKLTHWRQLASQTAESIRACVHSKGRDTGKSVCNAKSDTAVYLANTNTTSPFGRAFRDFLNAELSARNIRLSDKPENAVIVRTDTQLVDRDGILPARDFPGPAAAISGGLVLANFATAGLVALGGAADYLQVRRNYTQGSQLLVTTSLYRDGSLMRSFANIFYIPTTDRLHYASGLPRPTPSVSGKPAPTPTVAVFKIVNN